jgi:hypothetical protein
MISSTVINSVLISPNDAEYVVWGRRRADIKRIQRLTPPKRNMGEKVGWIVECAARHYINSFVNLQNERIMRWQTVDSEESKARTRYREIDSVHRLPNGYVFYEIKLTTEPRMTSGHGLTQLRAASKTFREGSSQDINVLLRLVYISENPVEIMEGKVKEVEITDLTSSKGVIWIKPEDIEAAAKEINMDLPSDWFDSEFRKTYIAESKVLSDPIVVDKRYETAFSVAFRKATALQY